MRSKYHRELGILYDPYPLARVAGALFYRQNVTEEVSGYTFIDMNFLKTGSSNRGLLTHC